MKLILLSFSFLFCAFSLFSQEDTLTKKDTLTYKITKNDGSVITGKILSQDAREILLLTNDYRQIFIPQHLIKSVTVIDSEKYNKEGEYIGEDKFATRYFITTNGLPIKKGEHYIQWNLFGPDFQFGIGEDLGVGIMTSWLGMPIIGTFKKSFQLTENTHLALGGLIGTGSWSAPKWGGALPFASISFGDRYRNIAFSGGYGAIWQPEYDLLNETMKTSGRALASIAGMVKISPKLSLVFDSFIMLPKTKRDVQYSYYDYVYNPVTGQNDYNVYSGTHDVQYSAFALIMPGIRWHQSEGKALQFGFTGVYFDNEFLPVPIPMVQWYRSI